VIDDRNLGAVKYLRVLIRSDVGIPVDPHLGSPGFSSRSKITASDSLASTQTPRTAFPVSG